MTDRPRPTPEQLARYADQFNRSETMRAFNLQISFPSADRVVIDLDPISIGQRGGLGTDAVNGGVLAAIFDVAIGTTAALIDPSRRSATLQLSMSFERPVRGNRLRVESWIDSAGEKTIFASATVSDERGQVCSRCQGVLRISSLAWQDGESPAVN